jgi:hypothetical protein
MQSIKDFVLVFCGDLPQHFVMTQLQETKALLVRMGTLGKILSDLIGCVEEVPPLQHGIEAIGNETVCISVVLCGNRYRMRRVCGLICREYDVLEPGNLWCEKPHTHIFGMVTTRVHRHSGSTSIKTMRRNP